MPLLWFGLVRIQIDPSSLFKHTKIYPYFGICQKDTQIYQGKPCFLDLYLVLIIGQKAMIKNTFFQPCDKQISVIFTLFPVSCEIELLLCTS